MNDLDKPDYKPFQPIFVVGNSRSGTTMMGRILGLSEDVFTFHELHFFEQLWSLEIESEMLSVEVAITLCAQLLSIQRDGYLAQRQPQKYEHEAKRIIRETGEGKINPSDAFRLFLQYEAGKDGKQRACDQTPRNVFYIEEILNLYPDARIINMVRDPRDVLMSQKKKWKRRFLGAKNIPLKESFRARVNYHPITISKIWHSSIKASDKFADDSRVLTVFFEKLLQNPQVTVRALCDFLKIPFEKNMLNIPQVGSSNRSDQAGNTGINSNLTESWKSRNGLSVNEVFWCQKINGSLMNSFGYAPVDVAANYFILFGSAIVFPFQLVLALIININRMKNVFSALKKRMQ